MNKYKKNTIALGRRLRSIRHQLGETQTTFGARFKLKRDDIANYERGLAEPPARLMGGLDKLGFSVSWLVSGDGHAREVAVLRQRCDELLSEVKKLKRLVNEAEAALKKEGGERR